MWTPLSCWAVQGTGWPRAWNWRIRAAIPARHPGHPRARTAETAPVEDHLPAQDQLSTLLAESGQSKLYIYAFQGLIGEMPCFL